MLVWLSNILTPVNESESALNANSCKYLHIDTGKMVFEATISIVKVVIKCSDQMFLSEQVSEIKKKSNHFV